MPQVLTPLRRTIMTTCHQQRPLRFDHTATRHSQARFEENAVPRKREARQRGANSSRPPSCLSELGYLQATVAVVASRAGVSRGPSNIILAPGPIC